MQKAEAINAIVTYRVPRGSVAVVENVAAAYVSELVTGKHVPQAATDKIIDATADIIAFIEHVRGLGFSPDLSNGTELRQGIERWKAQQEKISTASAVE